MDTIKREHLDERYSIFCAMARDGEFRGMVYGQRRNQWGGKQS